MNIELIGTTLQSLNTATNGISKLLNSGNFVIGTTLNYPPNTSPVVRSSGNAANAAAVATLPASATRTNFITGFDITSAGATGAAIVTVTVAGILGGTLSYTYATVVGATVLNAPLSIRFPAPLPASAVNTAITVTLPALGAGNTNATVTAYGYLL